jgi:arabinogalactan oligomer/maltooligosaccharide transport system permease protein
MKNLKLGIVYTILGLVSLAHLFPTFWVVLASFKPGDALFSDTLFPKTYTISHYVDLIKKTDYLIWLRNSIKISLISTFLGTFLTIITSYALSRYRFKGRKAYMNFILVITMFPGLLSLIAIFIILLNWGLLDSHTALILSYSTGSLTGWVLVAKGYIDNFSRSLDESARMDGAGHWTIFSKVILPLCKPLIVFISLMTFSGVFVDYIFAALIIHSPEKVTMPVGLYHMVNDKLAGGVHFTQFAGGSVLIAVPITLLFLLMNRFLVQGLTAGANKE